MSRKRIGLVDYKFGGLLNVLYLKKFNLFDIMDESNGARQCMRCDITRPLTEFSKRGKGYRTKCNYCICLREKNLPKEKKPKGFASLPDDVEERVIVYIEQQALWKASNGTQGQNISDSEICRRETFLENSGEARYVMINTYLKKKIHSYDIMATKKKVIDNFTRSLKRGLPESAIRPPKASDFRQGTLANINKIWLRA